MRRLLACRAALAAPATLLLLLLPSAVPTGGSASLAELETPALEPEEVYLLEELATWVRGAPLTQGLLMVDQPNVAEAVRRRARSFEMFRRLGDETARSKRVSGLPYGGLILQAAQRHQVDELLLAAMMEAESGFDPLAVSAQGALGLMQVMPETAEHYNRGDAALDPAVNVDLGARYLADLLELFDGDVALALAAYNAGPGNVLRYGGVPPFRETRRYLDRVLDRYVVHQQAVWHSTEVSAWIF